MAAPIVSFVVPCYKLAHLLPDCIGSIQSQSYEDFEVLVMDDCSPDNTEEMVRSFRDPRVKYVRNDQNIGHLRNYNKGISLSRGKYVWLISADDYLRVPHVLKGYVDLLERSSALGYVFCAGVGVRDGIETRVVGRFPRRGKRIRIIPGHVMLRTLLNSNFVLAASGLVRRACYAQLGSFPLNMPWAGDWYLWCLFALHYDVGYFDEPMVCYRDHPLSMTRKLTRESLLACALEEVAIPWIIRSKAEEAGFAPLAKDCLTAVAHTYARVIASERYRDAKVVSLAQFEDDLLKNIASERERDIVRARLYACAANQYYSTGDVTTARRMHGTALEIDPWMPEVLIKEILLSLGRPGAFARRALQAARQTLTGA
jgi:glycosyltransferase involved in cell wall biosynthesis